MRVQTLDAVEQDIVIDVIKDAFQAPPWNMIMPESEIIPRLTMFVPGTKRTLAAVDGLEICGLIWYGIARTETLPAEIVSFLERFPDDVPCVYCAATAVRLQRQSQGIGRQLTVAAHQVIAAQYPRYVMYSRMRSDNPRIINVRQSQGFKRTGISEEQYGVKDEWWYKTQL